MSRAALALAVAYERRVWSTRRTGRDRRGRPRVTVDLAVVDALIREGWPRALVARTLKVGVRTIDRRIAERRHLAEGSPPRVRCSECGATPTVTDLIASGGRCPNNHAIHTGILTRP